MYQYEENDFPFEPDNHARNERRQRREQKRNRDRRRKQDKWN